MLVFSTHAFTEGDVAVGVGVGMAAISTHAFTEGDTFFFTPYPPTFYFNSRLHGRRRYVYICSPYNANFNSRLHGRRRASSSASGFSVYFNSRLHGRRPIAINDIPADAIFQLTPSRKATANSNNFCC